MTVEEAPSNYDGLISQSEASAQQPTDLAPPQIPPSFRRNHSVSDRPQNSQYSPDAVEQDTYRTNQSCHSSSTGRSCPAL
ncbi:hypothetical protein N7453_004096 [Penicillium expansum]|nr:hypothetical protein N7453_004096 [Penicillium expansum]